jgi:hypothetical protein
MSVFSIAHSFYDSALNLERLSQTRTVYTNPAYDDMRLPRRPRNIESLNFEYENAYTDNTFKEACITKLSLHLLLDRDL